MNIDIRNIFKGLLTILIIVMIFNFFITFLPVIIIVILIYMIYKRIRDSINIKKEKNVSRQVKKEKTTNKKETITLEAQIVNEKIVEE